MCYTKERPESITHFELVSFVLTVSSSGCLQFEKKKFADLYEFFSGHSCFQCLSFPYMKHALLFLLYLVLDIDRLCLLFDLLFQCRLAPLSNLLNDLPLSFTYNHSSYDFKSFLRVSNSRSFDLVAPVTSLILRVSLLYLRVSLR